MSTTLVAAPPTPLTLLNPLPATAATAATRALSALSALTALHGGGELSGAHPRSLLPHQVGDLGRVGADTLGLHVDLRVAQQALRRAALLRHDDRHNVASLAGTRGATGAVQVRLVLGGRVHVDHELDAVHMHPARGHIGRDEHACVPAREARKVAVAGTLREVAVQVHCRDPRAGELLGQTLGLVLGSREEHSATRAGGERRDELTLGIGVGDVEDVMCHVGHGTLGRIDLVDHRCAQEALDDAVHVVVERGREQHALAVGRRGLEDAGHAGQEAQVGHVIGLVEHRDAHGIESDDTLAHEVLETPGAGDDDVGAAADALLLPALGDAAEDGDGAQAVSRGERRDHRVDLGGELARRREDEAARVAGSCAAASAAGLPV